MDFNSAISLIAEVLSATGTTIDTEQYDGAIVKKLEASNTLDEGRTTNQTHIAITGAQMDIFPYLRADGYFNDEHSDAELKKYFFTEINKIVLSKNIRMTSSEDKRLGTHFVSKEDLLMGNGTEREISRFPEKVLKYLWDDAFKFTKEDVFNLDKVKSLEDVIEIFVTSTGDDRFLVFKENIFNTLVQKKSS